MPTAEQVVINSKSIHRTCLFVSMTPPSHETRITNYRREKSTNANPMAECHRRHSRVLIFDIEPRKNAQRCSTRTLHAAYNKPFLERTVKGGTERCWHNEIYNKRIIHMHNQHLEAFQSRKYGDVTDK